ncbi:MAG TPA: RraA family protein [Alphaproteobacteria bacterium]|jgi:regulator of RNase E activity RraA
MSSLGFDRAKIAQCLYSAVLSDVMDDLGLMDQAMRPFVRPLDDALVLFGRARTGLYMPRYGVVPGEDPYEVEIALIDDLKPGDVAVLACDGPTTRVAPWGELLSTAAAARRAAGCVTDGLVRDIRRIREMRFPLFHGGIGPLDTKGRAKMMERDCPVACGGVKVASGDYIFGDADGVVVIPAAKAEEVFKRAFAKVSAEDDTRAQLEAGKTLREVFDKFGVL